MEESREIITIEEEINSCRQSYRMIALLGEGAFAWVYRAVGGEKRARSGNQAV